MEEPLEIRIGGTPLTVTMRTPGDDIDLAAGFLFGEGLLQPAVDLRQIRMCDENVADVTLEAAALPLAEDVERATDARRSQRNFLTTSACGVCGKESIEAIRVTSRYDIAADAVRVSPRCSRRCRTGCGTPSGCSPAPAACTRPGCSPRTARCWCCARTWAGTTRWTRSSAGRCASGRLPLAGHILLVSGRASFELVQKACMAGIPVLAAVSAPSSLAVGLAEEAGLTLVGFLRGTSMNVYTGIHRLTAVPAPA